ncbi:alcohol dehydrogenase catalytic domain-containing protein [Sneathiella chungangensis]|uniref:alcohol dehydrogenase n=1 Tax=Sneathiella chungangensis TaxID=1418234 RepID=A0A845MB58_9PROT|nr:alcohol dehydrogenase [Sneathiella chungangensis]MZR21052.1 alcohol dehydrogenase catalytic domain-containing protein [Sneathiella chungangensis]
MKSFQFEEYGAPLVENTGDAPTVSGDEVLMDVTACGVCHSDIHIWEGYFDLGNDKKLDIRGGRQLPHTLGHEIVGTVAAVGENVTDVKVGDKRVVYPWIGCGKCAICESGEEQLCSRPRQLGIDVAGGYADTLLVPHSRYLLDYGALSKDLACTYTCSGLTAYSALQKVKSRTDGGKLLIIGAGGVGLAAMAIAKSVTDAEIYVADIDPAKRDAGIKAGAVAAIDPSDPAAFKSFMGTTGGGVNATIDFVGAESSAAFGAKVLAKGGKLVIVGLFGGGFSMPLPMFPIKAISVEGSYVGNLREMRELMELAKAGKLSELAITPRPMKEAYNTLEDLRAGKIVGRVVLQS